MNKAIFLDRDGTINFDKNYLYKINDFVFIPGAIEALKMLQQAGFLLIIITNQSGIARGFYTEEDFQRLNSWVLAELEKNGIKISAVYYCPHSPDAKCQCRKPNLGLFETAIKDFDIDIASSFAVGDKLRDCAICEKTKCKGFLITNKKETRKNIKNVSSLLEAAEYIVKEEKNRK